YLKYEALTGSVISLADGSASTISDVTLLIDIVLDFIFENHIPFKSGYEILPANQEYYFYKCIVTRTCCLCGKPNADIDHFSKALGRRDRKTVDHTEYDFAALCRAHHTEKHQIGLPEFKAKYHVQGITLNEETIKRLRIGG
ncbi:putative HNHc nuclease, partial [Melissococcus plutonius]